VDLLQPQESKFQLSSLFFSSENGIEKKTQQTPSTKKAEQTFLPTNFQW
jgi:hypothetical protein